jgi:hypothetical protein
VGCAQNTSKSMQKEAEYIPVSETKDNQTEGLDEKHNSKVVKYDKRVYKNKRNNAKLSETKKTSEEKGITEDSFKEISKQKLQQLFEISLLLDNPDTKEDMKKYAQKHAERLFIRSKNVNISKQIQQLNFADADSIIINKITLLNMKEVDEFRQFGKYNLQIIPYKNGKKQETINKKAKIFFEIENLNIDGKIYQTIKGKILKID